MVENNILGKVPGTSFAESLALGADVRSVTNIWVDIRRAIKFTNDDKIAENYKFKSAVQSVDLWILALKLNLTLECKTL